MPDMAQLEMRIAPGDGALSLHGAATIKDAAALSQTLEALPKTEPISIDLSHLSRIDTAAAYALIAAQSRIASAGGRLVFFGTDAAAARLIDRVRAAAPQPVDKSIHKPTLSDRLENFGRSVAAAGQFLLDFLGILGLFLARLVGVIRRPRDFRVTALVHHIEEVGLKAVPIVALMAFLIGVVLAFQGATQLRQFGAEVFVVDLIAISILRELGILLTAIVVAGRTASAFTAAIGSMKMREEIDAMRTLAIDPGHALIVPRILALLIALPILGVVANIAGLLGGAIMSWIELGISPAMFQTRLFEGTDIRHVWVGLVKAPVFAVIIGVIGCRSGLEVGRDAESLGQMTSSAVVAAIFAVIVADAVFSVFFAQIGV
ncbi:MAG: MlaE family lipid ABC transporter permease subunit [Pseudomonadota bacterium]